jgi:hypothetical protein
MIKPDLAFESQFARLAPKARNGDTISERVMDPAQLRRLGRDLNLRVEELLIVTVARPEHHAVFAERHRLLVAIGRDVAN